MCKNEEETTDHLLLFCEKAIMLWLLISLFGVQWVMHSSACCGPFGKKRNRRAFNDVERNDQEIKSIFLYTFVKWVRVYIEEHTFSLIDFVDWLATK